ncbi:MAG: ATP-binding protein [Bacteroidales bacterium]|nr:ATP-binding protein [Bacteroidales bacterium]
MEYLISRSEQKIQNAPRWFRRYLFDRIKIDERLIGIKGARGSGKTTLLLQLAKNHGKKDCLYVALDDLFFSENTLYSLAEKFNSFGGALLLLDEVHKYPDWSRELKLIYDDFEDLHVVFTSSSLLDLYKGESDLSRRLLSYHLEPMSFREYMLYHHRQKLPVLTLNEMLESHVDIAIELHNDFKPFKYFSSYLRHGAYPYFKDDEQVYYQKLMNTVNLILDIDIMAVENISYDSIARMKRLIYIIASNVPFIPNISKLSEKIGLPRNNLVQVLQVLEKAEIIRVLYKKSKSVSVLSKPDKIWMNNSNLNYALSSMEVNSGTLRETFFLQNVFTNHDVVLPKKGDFLVDEKYIFEIGGKNKSKSQIQDLENSYLVKDDISIGALNSLPLWMFGLMY